jgi:glutamate mutase epsilon subunit
MGLAHEACTNQADAEFFHVIKSILRYVGFSSFSMGGLDPPTQPAAILVRRIKPADGEKGEIRVLFC